MKISIITVCYNSAATIRDTLESVLSQTYPNIEYIIVDGASTDATLAIIAEYRDRIAHLISEPDRGLYDAMNKGIRAATGDVIGILNSDDFYENNTVISDVAACFTANPHSDLIFGDIVFVNPAQLDTITRHYRAHHFRAWKLRFGWMPPHPATFIRQQAYQSVGLYALDYKISADYEMFVRMLLVKRLNFTRLDKVLVRMRAGGVSSAGIRSNIRLNAEIVKACRTNGIYTNIALVLTKIPFKLLELIRKPSKIPA
jgi:glycosyltransferase involved in cell wall biosynthesis